MPDEELRGARHQDLTQHARETLQQYPGFSVTVWKNDAKRWLGYAKQQASVLNRRQAMRLLDRALLYRECARLLQEERPS